MTMRSSLYSRTRRARCRSSFWTSAIAPSSTGATSTGPGVSSTLREKLFTPATMRPALPSDGARDGAGRQRVGSVELLHAGDGGPRSQVVAQEAIRHLCHRDAGGVVEDEAVVREEAARQIG